MVKRHPLHARRARLRRTRQRGAALFVVVLVISLLMGIGMFAARSAALATAGSGSERQMNQARYVAEYGLTFATAVLSNSGAQSYLARLRSPAVAELCYGQQLTMLQRTCYRVLYGDMQNLLQTAGFNVVDLDSLGGPVSVAGTTKYQQGDFVVELADLSEGFTMPGFDLGHGKALKFWYVNATATGQTRLVIPGATAFDPTAAETSSTQTVRSRILVGPFPTN